MEKWNQFTAESLEGSVGFGLGKKLTQVEFLESAWAKETVVTEGRTASETVFLQTGQGSRKETPGFRANVPEFLKKTTPAKENLELEHTAQSDKTCYDATAAVPLASSKKGKREGGKTPLLIKDHHLPSSCFALSVVQRWREDTQACLLGTQQGNHVSTWSLQRAKDKLLYEQKAAELKEVGREDIACLAQGKSDARKKGLVGQQAQRRMKRRWRGGGRGRRERGRTNASSVMPVECGKAQAAAPLQRWNLSTAQHCLPYKYCTDFCFV